MQQIVIDIAKGFINGVSGLEDEQEIIVRDYDVEKIQLQYLKKDEKGKLYLEEIWNSEGLKES